MADINSVIAQQLGVTRSKPVGHGPAAGTTSFDDILAKISETDTPLAPVHSDRTSKLPSKILDIVQRLLNGTPLDEDQLKTFSKLLQSVASGLVNLANQTIAPEQSKQVNFDLDIIIIGSLKLLTNYAYKPAIKDIVKLIRSLDSRSDCFETLEQGLTDLIKAKSFDLTGQESFGKPNRSGSEKAATTYDIQYSLWEALSVIKGDTQVNSIIDLFDRYNQMVSAKVDIDGTAIDSLVESGKLTEETISVKPDSLF